MEPLELGEQINGLTIEADAPGGVTIKVRDYAGTYDNPSQSARYTLTNEEIDRMIAWLTDARGVHV
jgi:hypothetical protein